MPRKPRTKKPDEYAGHYNLTQKRWEPVVDEERHTLEEWEKISGVSVELMIDRNKRGWDWEDAIWKRPRKYKNNEYDRLVRTGQMKKEDVPVVEVVPEPVSVLQAFLDQRARELAEG